MSARDNRLDHSLDCSHARTLLFVPGNRPERFAKAVASGADAVVLDLEDAVPIAAKAAAREAVLAAWASLHAIGVPLVVRSNAWGSAEWAADLACLRNLAGIAALMLPKAESADAVQGAHEATGGVPILPLIESAAGYDAVKAIAAAPGCQRLVVGHIDFMADTGIACGNDQAELDPLRFAVAMATRLAGLAPAIDGVTVQIDDEAVLRSDTLRARRFGFSGKLCIHPRQIAGVHAAFAPSDEDMAWARRVIAADAASYGGAVQLDGRMVDVPVVLRARQLLAQQARA
ncbi:CoA ester lyase [Pigmentiphaga aceris]|uniref:CoA ester lyase n=1 Tax=Pigmentiphaga aceris TaxID=1940612 RepID=A0A5C0ATW0_9BURK|nr:CoA ester lyase [Pigmentiphaga aceris]QEI05116.1 CoA ester lyase [Pigmentiphaga aceris]